MNANRNHILAAIRGPIVLITLGTLVAVDYAGGYSFARTWPVLVIVFGVLKLAERLFVKARNRAGGWGNVI